MPAGYAAADGPGDWTAGCVGSACCITGIGISCGCGWGAAAGGWAFIRAAAVGIWKLFGRLIVVDDICRGAAAGAAVVPAADVDAPVCGFA